jgi:hypothetical protein
MAHVKFADILQVAKGLGEHLETSVVKKIKTEASRLEPFTQGKLIENSTTWLNARAESKGYASLNNADIRVSKNQPCQLYALAYNQLTQNQDKTWSRTGNGDLSYTDEFPSSDEQGVIYVPSKFVLVPPGTIMPGQEVETPAATTAKGKK